MSVGKTLSEVTTFQPEADPPLAEVVTSNKQALNRIWYRASLSFQVTSKLVTPICMAFYFLLFTFGTVVGSFLNALVPRLYTGEPIVSSRSHCPKCKRVLRWYDLIPVFSWIWLRGRCRYCQKPISIQHPLVELVMGILAVLIFFTISSKYPQVSTVSELTSLLVTLVTPKGVTSLSVHEYQPSYLWLLLVTYGYLLFICAAMVAIFVYDLRHQIIPDKILIPTVFISFAKVVISSLSASLETGSARNPIGMSQSLRTLDMTSTLVSPVSAALGAGLFFLGLVLVTKGRGMGGGDVKLAFLMGLVLGWPCILVALYLAFLTGAFVSLILIALGRKHFGQTIPFGPFLSASTIATLLFGEQLLKFGRGIFGL